MDKMNIKDIDFSKLEKSNSQGTKSTIYFDGDSCIKVFNDYSSEELTELYAKFLEIDGIKVNGVIFPNTLIMEDGKLKAYIMTRVKNSMTLNDFFLRKRYIQVNDILEATFKVSLVLRELHDNDIICQDLSFDNILINSDGKISFVDMDGCSHERFYSPYVSGLLNHYVTKYCKKESIVPNRKTDKLSLMLAFFQVIFLKEIQEVKEKEYKSLSSNVSTLENLYSYRNLIINKRIDSIFVPYLDEFINLSDDYVIDRNKQVSVKAKIMSIFNK